VPQGEGVSKPRNRKMAVRFMVSRTGDYFKVLKNWSIVFFKGSSYFVSHPQAEKCLAKNKRKFAFKMQERGQRVPITIKNSGVGYLIDAG
jgi:hypothetical protein